MRNSFRDRATALFYAICYIAMVVAIMVIVVSLASISAHQ